MFSVPDQLKKFMGNNTPDDLTLDDVLPQSDTSVILALAFAAIVGGKSQSYKDVFISLMYLIEWFGLCYMHLTLKKLRIL